MDKLVLALGPAFAAGFAIQRLLEILDPIIDKLKFIKNNKKIVLGLISLVIGLILAFGLGLRVLQPLGLAKAGLLDEFVTAMVISAGTEGFNSIMKFLGYSKEDKKADAADKKNRIEATVLDEIQAAV